MSGSNKRETEPLKEKGNDLGRMNNNDGLDVACPICLDSMIHADVSFLSCAHKFHARCVNEWLRNKNNCPVCRFPLQESNDQLPEETSDPVVGPQIELIPDTAIRIGRLREERGRMWEDCYRMWEECDRNWEEYERMWEDIQRMLEERDRMLEERDNMSEEHDSMSEEHDRMWEEYNRMWEECQVMLEDRDRMLEERNIMLELRDRMLEEHNRLNG